MAFFLAATAFFLGAEAFLVLTTLADFLIAADGFADDVFLLAGLATDSGLATDAFFDDTAFLVTGFLADAFFSAGFFAAAAVINLPATFLLPGTFLVTVFFSAAFLAAGLAATFFLAAAVFFTFATTFLALTVPEATFLAEDAFLVLAGLDSDVASDFALAFLEEAALVDAFFDEGANMTGPECPLGCLKSPDLTPRFKAMLTCESNMAPSFTL